MYMLCQSHLPWFDYQNNIQWKVQIMELLAVQFSPCSCHFFALSYTNSPQHCSKAFSVFVVILAWHKVVAQIRSSCRFPGVCSHSCSDDGYISAVTDGQHAVMFVPLLSLNRTILGAQLLALYKPSPLFPFCSSEWQNSPPDFLYNQQIPSSQLFHHPLEPNSVTLQMEAVHSSESSEQTFTAWCRHPHMTVMWRSSCNFGSTKYSFCAW